MKYFTIFLIITLNLDFGRGCGELLEISESTIEFFSLKHVSRNKLKYISPSTILLKIDLKNTFD
jgi:hypothetical protein